MTQKLETLTIHAGCEPDPTTKARITPGDTAVVLGAGPIGTMVALAVKSPASNCALCL